MVTITCSGKFHAFALAEQLQRHDMLTALHTSYAYQKNNWFRRLAGRIDKEAIPVQKIHTAIPLAFPMKMFPRNAYLWNNWFDRLTASRLGNKSGKVLIGWSGMSLHTIKKAKKLGMITVLERGSSHIEYQNEILKEEYARYDRPFSIDQRVIEKELKEYEAADYIAVPSKFVYNSFAGRIGNTGKLVLNNYGAGKMAITPEPVLPAKFRILYLGTLCIRKGAEYLFRALNQLSIPEQEYDVQFIGAIDPEVKQLIEKYRRSNWQFTGHINHYDLPQHLALCSIGIQPSLEEGLSMVIPQMLSAGIPVIGSTNSGGEDVIKEGQNGFVVPVRSPEAIAEKINWFFNHPGELSSMRKVAAQGIRQGLSWNDYGDRYAAFLQKITG